MDLCCRLIGCIITRRFEWSRSRITDTPTVLPVLGLPHKPTCGIPDHQGQHVLVSVWYKNQETTYVHAVWYKNQETTYVHAVWYKNQETTYVHAHV
jgi:hypothetical protein